MKLRAFIVIVSIAALLSATTGALASASSRYAGQGKRPRATCGSPRISVSVSGRVTISGSCRVGGTPIPSLAHVTYSGHQVDQRLQCATKAVTVSKTFTLQPQGMADATLAAYLTPRNAAVLVTDHKSTRQSFQLQSDPLLECATTATTPFGSTSELCDQAQFAANDTWHTDDYVNCGHPTRNGWGFATTLIVAPDGTVSVGPMVTPTGNCRYRRDDQAGVGSAPQPFSGSYIPQVLYCADGSKAGVEVSGWELDNSSGRICSAGQANDAGGMIRMNLPSGLTGSLYLTEVMSVFRGPGDAPLIGPGFTTSAWAKITLAGAKEAC